MFGEGSAHARVVLVGERPGDMEDRAGKPFVGPAGRVLDRAREAAGIDRGAVYVTNAVKHSSFVPRGKAWQGAGERRRAARRGHHSPLGGAARRFVAQALKSRP